MAKVQIIFDFPTYIKTGFIMDISADVWAKPSWNEDSGHIYMHSKKVS
jgi:hypothetical protein